MSEKKLEPDIVEQLRDLYGQATKERSHYYTGAVIQLAIAEITRFRSSPPGWREGIEAAAKVCERRAGRHAEDRKRIEATSGHDPRVIDACIAAEDEGNEAADEIRALTPPG